MKRLYIGNFVAIPYEIFNKLAERLATTNYKLRGISQNIETISLNTGLIITAYSPNTYHKFVALHKIEKLLDKRIFIIDRGMRTQTW